MGPRRLPAPGRSLRMPADRHRRPRPAARSTTRSPSPDRPAGVPAWSSPRRSRARGVSEVANKDELARQGAAARPRRACDRRAGWHPRPAHQRPPARRRADPAPAECRRRDGDPPHLRDRRQGRDAEGVRRHAARARRAPRRGGPRRRGEQLHARRRVQGGVPGSVLRDVHRRAADGGERGRALGARLRALRVDVRGLLLARVRLHPHGRRLRGEHPPLRIPRRLARSAPTGRHRWRSRTSRRCARCTPRRCSTRATRSPPRSSSRRWRTSTGISYIRTTRGAYPVLYDNGEDFPVGGAKVLRHERRRRRDADRRRASRCTPASPPRTGCRAAASMCA